MSDSDEAMVRIATEAIMESAKNHKKAAAFHRRRARICMEAVARIKRLQEETKAEAISHG